MNSKIFLKKRIGRRVLQDEKSQELPRKSLKHSIHITLARSFFQNPFPSISINQVTNNRRKKHEKKIQQKHMFQPRKPTFFVLTSHSNRQKNSQTSPLHRLNLEIVCCSLSNVKIFSIFSQKYFFFLCVLNQQNTFLS